MVSRGLLLAAALLALTGQTFGQLSMKEEIERQEQWKTVLCKFFERVNRPLMMEVTYFSVAPNEMKPIQWQEQLDLFAQGYGLVIDDFSGSLALHRSFDLDRAGWAHSGPAIYTLVKTLPEELRATLTEEGLKLDQIPEQNRSALLRAIAISPEAALDILDNWSAVRIKLNLEVAGEVLEGDKRVSMLSIGSTGRARVTPTSASSAMSSGTPIPKFVPKNGTLDFGSGEVLSTYSLMAQAKKSFGKSYLLDLRLQQLPVFVKGAWTEESFADSLRALTSTLPLTAIEMNRESQSRQFKSDLTGQLEWMRSTADSAVKEVLDIAINGSPVSGAKFEGQPWLPQNLQNANLSRYKFRMSPRMTLNVLIPGARESSGSNSISKSFGLSYP